MLLGRARTPLWARWSHAKRSDICRRTSSEIDLGAMVAAPSVKLAARPALGTPGASKDLLAAEAAASEPGAGVAVSDAHDDANDAPRPRKRPLSESSVNRFVAAAAAARPETAEPSVGQRQVLQATMETTITMKSSEAVVGC